MLAVLTTPLLAAPLSLAVFVLLSVFLSLSLTCKLAPVTRYIVAIPGVAEHMRGSARCIDLLCRTIALVQRGAAEMRVPRGEPHVLRASSAWTVRTEVLMALQGLFPRLVGTNFELLEEGAATPSAVAARRASLVHLAACAAKACESATASFIRLHFADQISRKQNMIDVETIDATAYGGGRAVGFKAFGAGTKSERRRHCSALHFPLQRLCTAALCAALELGPVRSADDTEPIGAFLADLCANVVELDGVPVPPCGYHLPPQSLLAVIEPPLQALVTAAQIEAGMWVRNGDPAVLAADYYRQSPSCVAQRDVDTASVQLGVLLLGAEALTTLVLRRFGVEALLLRPTDAAAVAEEQAATDADPEQQQRMAAAAITLLVRVALDVPGLPLHVRLRRELVHQLLAQGVCRHSAFEEGTLVAVSEGACCGGLLNDAPSAAHIVSRRVLADIARRLPATASRGAVYELWSSSGAAAGGAAESAAASVARRQLALLREYDPTFPHLTNEEHQAAVENLRVLRRRHEPRAGPESDDGAAGAVGKEWRAPVSALPAAGSGPLAAVRDVLCCAPFARVLATTLCAAQTETQVRLHFFCLPSFCLLIYSFVRNAASLRGARCRRSPRALARAAASPRVARRLVRGRPGARAAARGADR